MPTSRGDGYHEIIYSYVDVSAKMEWYRFGSAMSRPQSKRCNLPTGTLRTEVQGPRFVYFSTKLDVENKGDESPVTIADRAAENKMRELINETFPEHGVYGEEGGLDIRGGEYVWVLDPIDGTKSFITGIRPTFRLFQQADKYCCVHCPHVATVHSFTSYWIVRKVTPTPFALTQQQEYTYFHEIWPNYSLCLYNMLTGKPLFGTLIALVKNGSPVRANCHLYPTLSRGRK